MQNYLPGTYMVMFGIFCIGLGLIEVSQMIRGLKPLDLPKLLMARFQVKSGVVMMLAGFVLNASYYLR